MEFTITDGRSTFTGKGNWEFIRGMETAEFAFVDPREGYPLMVTRFGDIFHEPDVKRSRCPLSGFWTMTEFDPNYYSHHLDRPTTKVVKRYQWDDFQFDTADFIEGFKLGCQLYGKNPWTYLVNPIEDIWTDQLVKFS